MFLKKVGASSKEIDRSRQIFDGFFNVFCNHRNTDCAILGQSNIDYDQKGYVSTLNYFLQVMRDLCILKGIFFCQIGKHKIEISVG